MKRWLSLVFTICLVLSLAACGNNTPPSSEHTGAASTDSAATKNTEVSKSEIPDETLGSFHQEATIAETVLVDENDVKITATGLNYQNYCVEVELLIENNSQKALSFICESMGYSRNSVNGYMIGDGYLNCDVAAGKKTNETVSFSYDNLRLFGIQEIADIELGFDISDDDYNDFYTGPRQIKTSAYDTYDYSTNSYQDVIVSPAAMNTFNYEMAYFTKDVVYEENGVKALSAGMMVNQDGEHLIILELENSTDKTVCAEVSNIVINGLVVNDSPYSSDAITPGKHGMVNMQLSSILAPGFWDAYGITEVRSVMFSLCQKDEQGNLLSEPKSVKMDISSEEDSVDTSGTELYNKDGLRIVSKKIVKDSSEYSKDLHVLLLAENNSGDTVEIDDVYDSLSINGFMTDYSFNGKKLENGQCGVIEIKLRESSLAENKIASASDITELEIGIEINQGNDIIDEPVLKITY